MTSFWKYFFVVVFLFTVAVAGYFGFRSYRSLKNPSFSAINAVTPGTPLIIEFREPLSFIKKLTQNTDFWKELTAINSLMQFQEQVLRLDSILSINKQIKTIAEQHKFLVCLHLVSEEKIEPLFISELPSMGYKLTIESFIKEVNGERSIVLQKKFLNTTISVLNIPDFDRLFYFAVHKGLFLGCFEESLVRDAIEQLNSGIPVNREEIFKKLEITAGKNVDANVYLNYPAFSDFAMSLTNKTFHPMVKSLAKLGHWSETDLIVKSDELLLTGYTMTSGDGSHLLDPYRQEPQYIGIPGILPYDISVLLHFGFTDFSKFLTSQKDYLQKNNHLQTHDSLIAGLNKRYGIDIDSDFYSWIGKEVALAGAGESTDSSANKFLVIHASDLTKAVESIDSVIIKVSALNKEETYGEDFEDYIIRHLDIPNLFFVLFGPLFSDINNQYYTTIKDYIVFANSPEALKSLISNFYLQKTLAANPNYRAFSNGISDKSNIFFYCNTRKALPVLMNFVNDGIAKEIEMHRSAIMNFEGVAVQFSFTDEMFYTSIYLRYNPAYQEIRSSGWEVELEGTITGKPGFVRNFESGKWNVVVFDDRKNMYLIDQSGKVNWKIPLIEIAESQVNQVEYNKDNKKQFLFNTKNYLYLIDPSGNTLGEYPVKLMTESTNGVAVLDYENKKDYRLLLALADNRIHNFDIHAKPVEGWTRITADIRVDKPVEHLTAGGKDYILITDENGHIIIANKKGEDIFSIKKEFQKAKNSRFYINQTNSKGVFITTDKKGKLVYITEKGKINRTDFGDYSEDHYFAYEDLSQDNSKDFIFLDKNKLSVYSRFKETILEFELPEKITFPPVLFENITGEILIGVVASAEGKVYLFNKGGQVYKSSNFKGNTPFIVGSLNNDGKLNLIIGDGNKLVNYLLE